MPIDDAHAIVCERLQSLVEGGLIKIRRSSIAVDISPAGIDKKSGVEWLCRVEGLDKKNILAIGDSPGDFPMFEASGHIACPSNAENECKAYVRSRKGIVARRSYASGVAKILSRIDRD